MDALMIILGVVATLVVLGALGSARSIVRPGRNRLWTDPRKEAGLEYEDVTFRARDGVQLKGWFLPAIDHAGPRPAVILVHGWLWNRLGTRSTSLLNDFPGGKPVLLFPLAEALVRNGYGVLMFDLRNFGESERKGVYTGGWLESRDLLGAVDSLAERRDVEPGRIGVVGFSVGGNILLHALPFTSRIRAGIAVQPADVYGFMTRYNRQYLGPLGGVLRWLTQKLYGLAGGPELRDLHPMYAAAGAREVPILFVQGTGDPWGGREDVESMIAQTPNPVEPVFPETDHRFDGYNWVVDRPEMVIRFFDEYLPDREVLLEPPTEPVRSR